MRMMRLQVSTTFHVREVTVVGPRIDRRVFVDKIDGWYVEWWRYTHAVDVITNLRLRLERVLRVAAKYRKDSAFDRWVI